MLKTLLYVVDYTEHIPSISHLLYICLFVCWEQDRLKETQTLLCLCTLTLGQEYINQPFSVVSVKVREMFKQGLIYRQTAPRSLHTVPPSTYISLNFLTKQGHKAIFPEYQRKNKRAEPCNYNMLHAGEKRNKWLRGFVMMISLSARGNYVTIVMYFPWVKVRNNEAGRRGCMFGMATY